MYKAQQEHGAARRVKPGGGVCQTSPETGRHDTDGGSDQPQEGDIGIVQREAGNHVHAEKWSGYLQGQVPEHVKADDLPVFPVEERVDDSGL